MKIEEFLASLRVAARESGIVTPRQRPPKNSWKSTKLTGALCKGKGKVKPLSKPKIVGRGGALGFNRVYIDHNLIHKKYGRMKVYT